MTLTAYDPNERSAFTIALPVRRSLEGLALALNHGLEPEQLAVYAFALVGVPVDDLRAACLSLAKTERFWPKPVDIRERAARLAQEKAEAAAAAWKALPPGAEPTYRCVQCLDDPHGWQLRRCPEARCDRHADHPPHTFVVRCPCWLDRHAARIDARRQAALQEGFRPPAECDALSDLREGRYRWAKPY